MATSTGGLATLAVGIGALGGLGAVAFRWLIEGFTRLFSGHADYSAAGHAANPLVPWLGPAFVVLAPAVGGLLYGPMVARWAPEARGHGVPEVMLAVARKGGRIRPQVALVKAFASALCIGSGGSVGREGPIVQIGSALGSTAGQYAGMGARRLRLLVACGAAAGIAATFNTPIAGVFFALEVILRDFEAEAFGAVVLSAVAAAAVGRAAFGNDAFLTLPVAHVPPPVVYPLFALLGLVAAVAGVAFLRSVYGAEDVADRVWRGPDWLRPAVGGLLLGVLLLVLPQMYGVGYPVLESAVTGHYALALVVVFMVGKLAATSLTLAIGGSGGVFAPSLFIGAMLGSAFGRGADALLPGMPVSSATFAVVGMGAVFAASARAPITAVLIIFELTGDYALILPLMLAVVVATVLADRLSPDSIYTLKLRRRGIDLRADRHGPLDSVTIAEVMSPPPADVDTEPLLTADQSLQDAARALHEIEADGLPVADPSTGRVAGWITHRAVLRAYHDARR